MNHLIFGVRNEGKSTLGYYLAEQTGRPIAIFDPGNRFKAWPESIVHGPDELEKLLDYSPLVIYQPSSDDELAEFGVFAEILFERECTILVDEASDMQSASWAHKGLDKLIRKMPHETSDVIQTLHAPADSWARCRSLAETWYIFRTWRQADLTAIATDCTEDAALAAQKLEPHHYIRFDRRMGTFERGGEPQKWFREIRAKGLLGHV